MEPRRVLMTGACGTIGTVLRPALREGLQELRLSDLRDPQALVEPETSVPADLTDFDAVQRAVAGVDAVLHLGAVPSEAAFEVIAGPNLHGAFHVFEACRRANVQRVVYASSTHASGMYPVGMPQDGSQRARPDGLYGASKVYGEALGSMYADRFGLSVVCLRIGAFQPKPRETRELSTWLSHADAIRLVRAALTADDVGFAIVYGASANARRWWPPDEAVGFVPEDDAERYAGELGGEDYALQGGPNTLRDHGGLGDVNADTLRARFDAPDELGIGIEEELFLLDPETLDLLPHARGVVEQVEGDPRFKLELPAAQLEIVTPPCPDVASAVASLAAARRDLVAAAEPFGRLMTAGTHPFTSELGVLTDDPRYVRTLAEYGERARRQLVSGLHLHVSLGGADRTLAVYNALRSHLPELAALAANAPFHAGRDTGLASIRPTIAVNLQRQGVPPYVPSWEWFANGLTWGERSDTVPDPRRWWFELRMHTTYGTLELRAPDAQSSVDDLHGVAAFAYGLIADLAARHDAGEILAADDSWRIDENRWSAMRDGVEGTLADLVTGERKSTRELLLGRLESFPDAPGLEHARALVAANGAIRTRAVAADLGVRGVAAWLADRF